MFLKISGFKKLVLSFVAIGTLAIAGASVQAADAMSDADKEKFGAFIKEYLMENPEVILEAVDKHRERAQVDQQKQAEQKIAEHMPYLTRKDAPSVGSENPDITVIEFFDYNCGYCKRALSDIQKVIKDDKNLRVVLKEMAILGESSRTAALWSLAAHKQGKFFDYHVALMNHRGMKNEESLMKLGEEIGLDVEKLKADAGSEEIASDLQKSMGAARDIGVRGTPAFIIGSQFIPGYIGEEGLKQAIAEEREKLKGGS